MPMDLTDDFLIFYREGDPRPKPNPDKNCIFYKVDSEGTEEFDLYVPRSRRPYGKETVELY